MTQQRLRHASYLALVAAIARGPSFLIPLVVAALFGANNATDAYFLSYSAVLLVGGTVAQGLEQAVVPFAAAEFHRAGAGAMRYLDWAAKRSAWVAVILWTMALPLLWRVSPSTIRQSTLQYALTFSAQVVAWCATAVYTGALIANHRIARATGSMLWRGAGALVAFIFVLSGTGLWIVPVGLGVGEVSRCLWARAAVHWSTEARPDGGGQPPQGLGGAAVAQVVASAAIGAAPLVERLFAASLGSGAISLVEYALRLIVIPSLLFEGALVPLTLARWTRATAEGRVPSRRDVWLAVLRSLGIAAVVGLGMMIGAGPFVRLVLAHGRFRDVDAAAVAGLFRILGVAYVANMCAQIVERHYIATVRNRVLAVLSIARAVVRISTMWLLLSGLGLKAFAIGFTVSDWLYLIALLVLLKPSRTPVPPLPVLGDLA